MSDNGFNAKIGFEVDNASVARAKAAVLDVRNAVNKAADDVIRAKEFDTLAKRYARIAVDGKGAVNVTQDLIKEFKKLGATDKEIDKTVKAFDRQVDAIKRSDEALEERARDEARRNSNPQTRLDRFEDVEGTSGKIGDVGDAAAALGQATGIGALGDFGAIFEGIEALARLKAGLEALPESFAATAQAVGLVRSAKAAEVATDTASAGASTAAATAETAQATASTGLAAASGAASVGIGAMMVALAPVAILLAGIAIAAKIMADGLSQANDDLKMAYAAQRQIQEFIRSGATSEEAQARLDEIQAVLDDERANLAAAKADYAEAFNAAANSIPIIGDLFARIADLFGAFRATKDEIGDAEKAVKENEKAQGALNKAREEGKFADNDAKKAAEDAAQATKQNTDATNQSTQQKITTEIAAYQSQEQILAQHLANETGLKGQAYNQQISMGAQAIAAIQNGFRPLNMSGASNAFKAGSFGGMRPIPTSNNTVNRSVGNLTINTTANPQDVIKVLNDVGLVG